MLTAVVVAGAVTVSHIQPAEASDGVDVEVRSIKATKEAPENGQTVGSDLSSLASKLTGTFGDYKSFRQLSMSSFSLGNGATHSISLPNGDRAEFSFKGKADDLLKLGVNVADRASISLRLSSGSTFFQAGLDLDGGMLIVAVTVTESDD
jgi:hypothetical protein